MPILRRDIDECWISGVDEQGRTGGRPGNAPIAGYRDYDGRHCGIWRGTLLRPKLCPGWALSLRLLPAMLEGLSPDRCVGGDHRIANGVVAERPKASPC